MMTENYLANKPSKCLRELTVHFLPRWLKSTSFSWCVRRMEPMFIGGLLAEGGPLILTIRWCELVIRKC